MVPATIPAHEVLLAAAFRDNLFFLFLPIPAILKRTEEGETTRALEEMARSDGQGVQHQW